MSSTVTIPSIIILTEVFRSSDIPWIAGFYVEHKNVLGMTVRPTVDNVLNGRHRSIRSSITAVAIARRSPSSTSTTSWSARCSACRSKAPSSGRRASAKARSGGARCRRSISSPSSRLSGPVTPPPHDEEVPAVGRRLAPAFGLTDFGASQSPLEPGAWSSQRHWHDGEDELVVMLEGEAVLIEDEARPSMRPGTSRSSPKASPTAIISSTIATAVRLIASAAARARRRYPTST